MKSAKYQFHTPGRLLFGDGCSEDVGKWMRELGSSRVLLVTDPGVAKAGTRPFKRPTRAAGSRG